MSTGNRAALHASLIRNIRYFIAGTIVFTRKWQAGWGCI